MAESIIWIWLLAALLLTVGLGRLFRRSVESDLGPMPVNGPTTKIHFGPGSHAYVGRAGDRVWLHVAEIRGRAGLSEHIEIILTPEQCHELASALNDQAVDGVVWAEQEKESDRA